MTRRAGWLALILLTLAPAPAALARRAVPKGFLGVCALPELTSRPYLLPAETRLMARSGVESVRSVFYWSDAQPYRTMEDVPPAERDQFTLIGGIPTTWRTLDPVVTAMARHRIRLLPTVLNAPHWASTDQYDPGLRILTPTRAHFADYARFMTVLVHRYGPRGSFWKAHPRLPRQPIRAWQIWNEPHLGYYWRTSAKKPWPVTYTALLKGAWKAIHAADPGGKTVLGGLTYESWKLLPRLYAAGARRWFDIAAIHPYTLEVGNIVRILELDRRVMTRHGDRRKPMYLTETSWPSAKGRMKLTYGYNVTRAGQARKITAELPLLARNRKRLGIGRVYWYKWLSYDSGTTDPFDYSGLRALVHGKPRSKPSFAAFRRAALKLEGRR